MSTFAPGFAGPDVPLYPTQGGNIAAGNVTVAPGGLITEEIDSAGEGAALLFETILGGGTFESLSIQPVFANESPSQSAQMLSVTNSLTDFAEIALARVQLFGPNVTPTQGLAGCSLSQDGASNLVVNGNVLRFCGRAVTIGATTGVTLAAPGFTDTDYQVQVSYNGAGPFTTIPSAVITATDGFTIHSDAGVSVSWLAMKSTQA